MTIRAHEQCTILPLTTLSSQQATIAKNSKTTFSYYTTNETQSMDHHLGYEAELVPSTCPEHTTACTAVQTTDSKRCRRHDNMHQHSRNPGDSRRQCMTLTAPPQAMTQSVTCKCTSSQYPLTMQSHDDARIQKQHSAATTLYSAYTTHGGQQNRSPASIMYLQPPSCTLSLHHHSH